MFDGMQLTGNQQFKITGGGANNKLWVQIIADVLGQPIKLINSCEGPAFGAAILLVLTRWVLTLVRLQAMQ